MVGDHVDTWPDDVVLRLKLAASSVCWDASAFPRSRSIPSCKSHNRATSILNSTGLRNSLNLRENCDLGQLHGALELEHLDQVNKRAEFASLLSKCGKLKALYEGRRVHGRMIESGHDGDVFLGNLLVQMYGSCGSLEDASNVFQGMCQRDVVSWNIMVTACAQNGLLQSAKRTFEKMPQQNVVSWNIMVTAYAESGHMQEAKSMFDKMPQRNVVSWNSMISAYAQNGHSKEALKLFRTMDLEGVHPSRITFLCILDACGNLNALPEGKLIHASILIDGLEADVVVGTALVNMYCNCGSLEDARNMLDKMPVQNVVACSTIITAYGEYGHLQDAKSVFDDILKPNVVAWTAVISAFAHSGHGKEALRLFTTMDLEGVQPNEVTFITVLEGCSSRPEGQLIHAEIVASGFQSGTVVATALVHTYGRFGSLQDAREVFNGMHRRNVVSWNAMLAAYVQNGHGKEALELFRLMDMEGMNPNEITLAVIIDSGVDGKVIHSSMMDTKLGSNVKVGTSLITMYGNCGSLEDAQNVFNRIAQKNTIAWTAIVAAYARNGHAKEALIHFQKMSLQGVTANEITFLTILSACSHAGLVCDGWQYFDSMSADYGIEPTLSHYISMIDLLGRAGQIDEAERLVYNMPFDADALAWSTLLGACKIHDNAEGGTRAAGQISVLDPANASPYVILSSIYSASRL